MRTYEIHDAAGNRAGAQTMEDNLAPVLFGGQTATLTHIDGEPAIQGEPLKLTDEQRAALPPLLPAESGIEAEATVGESVGDAHSGIQLGGLGLDPAPFPPPERTET